MSAASVAHPETPQLFPEPDARGGLYGKLVGDLTKHYRRRLDVLHRNAKLVTHFGETLKPFNVVLYVDPADDHVSAVLSASVPRGEDAEALIESLERLGFSIGRWYSVWNEQHEGYCLWNAPVKRPGLEFTLIFYTPWLEKS